MIFAAADLDMGAFKHVVVPLGVVIGLGVAHIVSSVSSYIDNRTSVRFALSHSLWTGISFLFFIALWWSVWELRHIPEERWSFFMLIYLMIGPALLYLAAALLLPKIPSEDTSGSDGGVVLDLGKHLETVGRPVFLSIAAAMAWLGLTEVALEDQDLYAGQRLTQSIGIVLLLILAARPTQRRATVLGFALLAVSVFAFIVFRGKLG